MKLHHYKVTMEWTGNLGQGTKDYRAYSRNHVIQSEGKPEFPGSSDPSFRGDPSRYNPEELLVSSLSSCHMLWYLHLCAVNGIVVTKYIDKASGTMEETPDGGGRFSEVILRPEIVITDSSKLDKAAELHHDAKKLCFIANSCNFPIKHEPVISVQSIAAER